MERTDFFHGLWAELRLTYLREQEPEKLRLMEEDGTLEEHLKAVQENFSERYQALCDRFMERFREERGNNASYEEVLGFSMTSASQAREILYDEISKA